MKKKSLETSWSSKAKETGEYYDDWKENGIGDFVLKVGAEAWMCDRRTSTVLMSRSLPITIPTTMEKFEIAHCRRHDPLDRKRYHDFNRCFRSAKRSDGRAL